MKHIIAKLFIVLLLLCPAALAQGDLLDGLIIKGDWVRGTATGVFGADRIEKPIKVDCPSVSYTHLTLPTILLV